MMKVFDLNGCVIRKGDPLYFEALKAIVKVLDIQEPGVIDENMPGFISLELRVPFRLEKGMKDVRLGDFIATRDPMAEASAEQQVNDILEGRSTSKPVRVLDRKVK